MTKWHKISGSEKGQLGRDLEPRLEGISLLLEPEPGYGGDRKERSGRGCFLEE